MRELGFMKGEITSGEYKGQSLELTLGSMWYDTKVSAGGKPLNGVQKIVITMGINEPTSVAIELYDMKDDLVVGKAEGKRINDSLSKALDSKTRWRKVKKDGSE